MTAGKGRGFSIKNFPNVTFARSKLVPQTISAPFRRLINWHFAGRGEGEKKQIWNGEINFPIYRSICNPISTRKFPLIPATGRHRYESSSFRKRSIREFSQFSNNEIGLTISIYFEDRLTRLIPHPIRLRARAVRRAWNDPSLTLIASPNYPDIDRNVVSRVVWSKDNRTNRHRRLERVIISRSNHCGKENRAGRETINRRSKESRW